MHQTYYVLFWHRLARYLTILFYLPGHGCDQQNMGINIYTLLDLLVTCTMLHYAYSPHNDQLDEFKPEDSEDALRGQVSHKKLGA